MEDIGKNITDKKLADQYLDTIMNQAFGDDHVLTPGICIYAVGRITQLYVESDSSILSGIMRNTTTLYNLFEMAYERLIYKTKGQSYSRKLIIDSINRNIEFIMDLKNKSVNF